MDIEAVEQHVYTPGQLICRQTDEHVLGEGVFVEHNGIYAGTVGRVQITPSPTDPTKKIVAVRSRKQRTVTTNVQLGDDVIARVNKIKEETVFVEILSVNGLTTAQTLDGVIKKRDIREKEIDKIQLDHCFIPGDIIKAKVCSYGDSRKIQLSTVADDLGVIFARSQTSANFMVPVSEEEMICPITKMKEPDFKIYHSEQLDCIRNESQMAFQMYDRNGTGFIEMYEIPMVINNIFMQLGLGMPDPDDVEFCMYEFDRNGDGRLSYMEFTKMLRYLSSSC